ncbi:hypothetical protein [Romboutsia sp. 13368]|uniref:hypothetical protein n=1 Tax=Romboutsia sp. 13368 TaxID=2708053 RepID=UPI0025E43A1C|nr:hypothetical protein [Romboutsia sp. 13368]
MLFENGKLKIEYIEECIDNDVNRNLVFAINIKDFDTPTLNIVYDAKEDIIVKTYIDEQFENIPKSHVVYKMFSLIEYEVIEIIRFMIEHM